MSVPPVRVTPERLDAWRAFLQAHASVVGALETELEAERDLPLPWYDVLVSLSDAGGRLRMQDLAERVLFSRSGLTRLVDRMAGAGLVTRERCEDDRRGTFAVLTPTGSARLREAAGVHLRGIHDHFTKHLSDADVRALTAALDKVLRGETGSGLDASDRGRDRVRERVGEGVRAPIPSS
jgi:DNA-binding MarR family transcriptional regulator